MPHCFSPLNSTPEELNTLNELDDYYKTYSEMTNQDRAFLNSVILKKRPKKLLEIGVSAGGSSIIMLNAIKNDKEAHLYSLDYSTQHYSIKDKLTGFCMDKYPELKKQWTLKTGGLALNFMDEISGGGDIFNLCLIDTVHTYPGEILDFLMALPYLKKDAVIIFHDTALHTRYEDRNISQWQSTNCILMSAITGDKIVPSNEPFKSSYDFTNIGAIQLNQDTFKNIGEIFNLLTIRWNYMPCDQDIKKLSAFIDKHYGSEYRNYFENAVSFQKKIQAIELSPIMHNKYTFLERLFSVKNERGGNGKCVHKVLSLLGIKFKFKL